MNQILFLFLKKGNKCLKAAVGEIEDQLSCNCVCLYQPWPWQNDEFPETLRKGLSHSQCHRGAGQEVEKERRGEIRGVSRFRWETGGRGGWTRRQWQRKLSHPACLKEEAGAQQKLDSPPLQLCFLHCLCWRDEVSVWNVWVRRRRMEWVDEEEGKDILQSFSMG